MTGLQDPNAADMSPPDSNNPAELYVICSLNDIPTRRARGFNLLRVAEDGSHKTWNIFIVRWGKHVFGYANQCPHQGVNLDWEKNQFLDPNGLRIMCGKHGALFEIATGKCVDGPCQGEQLTPIELAVVDDDICAVGIELVTEE